MLPCRFCATFCATSRPSSWWCRTAPAEGPHVRQDAKMPRPVATCERGRFQPAASVTWLGCGEPQPGMRGTASCMKRETHSFAAVRSPGVSPRNSNLPSSPLRAGPRRTRR